MFVNFPPFIGASRKLLMVQAFALRHHQKCILCIFILPLLFPLELFSQKTYHPLKSKGEVPQEFIKTSKEKYLAWKESINQNLDKDSRQIEESFYLSASYTNDYLYRSGSVCFDTDINIYIDKIMGHLLKDSPELASKIRVYIMRSAAVNAFIAPDGSIFITIGLLAKLENEAQLAFVLSHEVIHFREKHSLTGYVQQVEVKNEEEGYKGLNYDQKLLLLSKHSRERETEADLQGLKSFYLKTTYNKESAKSIMNVLLYSYLPFGNSMFKFDYLQTPRISFPLECKLKQYNSIETIEENYADSMSDHPNIKKRIEAIDKLLSSHDKKDLTPYIISKEEFIRVRETARFELVHICMQTQRYEEALYYCYLLMAKYPGHKFLETAGGIALLELACYKYNDDFPDIHINSKYIQGGSQQVYYLFEQLTDYELSVLAADRLFTLAARYPNDQMIREGFSKAVENLVFGFNKRINELLNTASPLNYMDNALLTLLKDNSFNNEFQRFNDMKKEIEKEKEELIMNKKKREAVIKEKRLIQKKGFALGIDKIIVVNPMVIRTDFRTEEYFQWESAEKTRYNLIEILHNEARKIDLDLELLDLKFLDNSQFDDYNDYCLISNWFSEKCRHLSEDYFMYNKYYISHLIKKYDTKYFAWTGLSIGLIENQRVNKHTIIDFYLFNIETGEVLLSQRKWIDSIDNKHDLNANVKNILKQIKNTR
ncbi:M48 family metallopeptidase [Candidatus Amoebophilus asiaticus]|nr:M48 family metallopeptidase [Candidatus Amoebophilus asiaticus]